VTFWADLYHNTHCLNFVQYRGRCAELPLWACAGHESESIVPANAYRIPRIPLVGMIFQILVDYWDGLSVGLPHYHKPSHYHYISFDKLTKLNRLLMDKSTIKSINDHVQFFLYVYRRVSFFQRAPRHLVNDTNILTVLSMIRSSDSVEHLKRLGGDCFGGAACNR